jgi:hypothetical protein
VRSEKLNFRDYASSVGSGITVKAVSAAESPKPADDDDFLDETITKIAQLGQVVSQLKQASAPKSFGNNSPTTGAVLKLDNLLGSFDPYLSEDQDTSHRQNGQKGSMKLSALLGDIVSNLKDLQDDVNDTKLVKSTPAGSLGDGINLTQDLVNLVQSLPATSITANPKYDDVMSKLMDVMEESKDLAHSRSSSHLNIAEDGTNSKSVRETINKTYSALNDVANLLLKEASEFADDPEPQSATSNRLSRISSRSAGRDSPVGIRQSPPSAQPSSGGSSYDSASLRLKSKWQDTTLSTPPILPKKYGTE